MQFIELRNKHFFFHIKDVSMHPRSILNWSKILTEMFLLVQGCFACSLYHIRKKLFWLNCKNSVTSDVIYIIYIVPVSAKDEINRRGTYHLLYQHLKHLMIKRITLSIINYDCNISLGMKLWNFSNHVCFWHKMNIDDPNKTSNSEYRMMFSNHYPFYS